MRVLHGHSYDTIIAVVPEPMQMYIVGTHTCQHLSQGSLLSVVSMSAVTDTGVGACRLRLG
jgi:hypothetical protein